MSWWPAELAAGGGGRETQAVPVVVGLESVVVIEEKGDTKDCEW